MSVNAVNLVKKICYNSRDTEFFLGDYFFGAPCGHETVHDVLNNWFNFGAKVPRSYLQMFVMMVVLSVWTQCVVKRVAVE